MPTRRALTAHVASRLRTLAARTDDRLDAARRRYRQHFGSEPPRHISAYRAFTDGRTVELSGRVISETPLGDPRADDPWWRNLRNTLRRFTQDPVPDLPLRVQFRAASARTVTDEDGFYHASLALEGSPAGALWEDASVALDDGELRTSQPVLAIDSAPGLAIISDIDDTVLESSIVEWKTAAQLAFLHNARTRKPLLGVAQLYQSLQSGRETDARNPIFYVSNSPWNLYDLLDHFLQLNDIPVGPLFLRRIGLDESETFGGGHGHKLERVTALIRRFPQKQWVLLGDSGQHDAEIYSKVAREFGSRIAAIYIRDVDLAPDTPRDRLVEGYIQEVTAANVPMLLVGDSVAIAEHAIGLGLIAPASLPGIVAEVRRDAQRPTVAQANLEAVKDEVADAVHQAVGGGNAASDKG